MTGPPDVLQGVFETMLVEDGRPLELDAHLGRMRASLAEVYGAEPPAGVGELVTECARDLGLGRVRVTVAPGSDPEVRTAPVVPAIVFPPWHGGPLLRPLVVAGGLGAHKWADRSRVEEAEYDTSRVPLITDADGSVLEASRGNVFLVTGGVLCTPPADGRLLPGITRRRVLAVARAAGVPVSERPVSFDELLAADEVFLTGAVRGVEPVRGCGGARWSEGPVTTLLARRLRQLWALAPAKEEPACP